MRTDRKPLSTKLASPTVFCSPPTGIDPATSASEPAKSRLGQKSKANDRRIEDVLREAAQPPVPSDRSAARAECQARPDTSDRAATPWRHAGRGDCSPSASRHAAPVAETSSGDKLSCSGAAEAATSETEEPKQRQFPLGRRAANKLAAAVANARSENRQRKSRMPAASFHPSARVWFSTASANVRSNPTLLAKQAFTAEHLRIGSSAAKRATLATTSSTKTSQ